MTTKKKYLIYFTALMTLVIMAANFNTPIKVGDKAPDFTLTTANAATVSLSDYKGKVVVIHLWSHTCPHCRESNQTLPDIVKPYIKKNLAYIMIDIDTDTTGWRNIIKEDKLNFAIHTSDPHDGSSKTMIDYNGAGTPCVNIVDEKGNIIAVNVSNAQLKKVLKKKLQK